MADPHPGASSTVELTVANDLGLHARASAKIVNLANEFDAETEIWLSYRGVEVSARSILGLMMFAAPKGARLTARATGPRAAEALARLEDLFRRRFDEEG
ncbi:MAG: HPr family phosphocarrier protein [Nitrospirae bacterium]|nr:MAG: HPr family phosphocarrier protein [Nitrospirota bacterium]